MRILMVTNTFAPHVGGVARSVTAFTEEYRRRGHRVVVVAPEFAGMSADLIGEMVGGGVVGELGRRSVELQLDRTGRAVALLANDHLGKPVNLLLFLMILILKMLKRLLIL